MKVQLCRAHCGATVLFVAYEKPPHKPNPLNATPTTAGNIRVDPIAGTYHIVTGEELAEARAAGELLYLSHFADCPARAAFRRTA